MLNLPGRNIINQVFFLRVSYESSSLPSPYLEIICLFSDGFFLAFHLLSYWVGQYDGELVVAVDSSSFETERFHGFSDVDGVEAATLEASVVEFPQEVARCEGFSLFAFFRSADEGEEGFHAGSYDAYVRWNMPQGISVVGSSMLEVSLYPAEDSGRPSAHGGF